MTLPTSVIATIMVIIVFWSALEKEAPKDNWYVAIMFLGAILLGITSVK